MSSYERQLSCLISTLLNFVKRLLLSWFFSAGLVIATRTCLHQALLFKLLLDATLRTVQIAYLSITAAQQACIVR